MRKILIAGVSILAFAAISACVVASKSICDVYSFFNCGELARFSTFYATSLRGSLFAGFLTLGGFLMSLKTFIIVNMKKEVYDSPAYVEKFESLKLNKPMLCRYKPLKDLSDVLFVTILSCLSTSILQLTVGLLENFYASVVCITAAAGSILLLGWTLYLIRVNLQDMFKHLDQANNKRK